MLLVIFTDYSFESFKMFVKCVSIKMVLKCCVILRYV